MMISKQQLLRFSVLASLTLGLAPFAPEPHVWGKIKWVMGGGEGMQTADYLDLLMHGSPWVMLIIALAWHALDYVKK